LAIEEAEGQIENLDDLYIASARLVVEEALAVDQHPAELAAARPCELVAGLSCSDIHLVREEAEIAGEDWHAAFAAVVAAPKAEEVEDCACEEVGCQVVEKLDLQATVVDLRSLEAEQEHVALLVCSKLDPEQCRHL
jgi:hypothetical protein